MMRSLYVYRIFHDGELIYVGKAETDNLAAKVAKQKNNPQIRDYCVENLIDLSDLEVDYLEFAHSVDCDLIKNILVYLYSPELNTAGKPSGKPNDSISLNLEDKFIPLEFKHLLPKSEMVIRPSNFCSQTVIDSDSDIVMVKKFYDSWILYFTVYQSILDGREAVVLDENLGEPIYLGMDFNRLQHDSVIVTGIDITEDPVVDPETGQYRYKLLYGSDSCAFLPLIRSRANFFRRPLMDVVDNRNCLEELGINLEKIVLINNCRECELANQGVKFVYDYVGFEEWSRHRYESMA